MSSASRSNRWRCTAAITAIAAATSPVRDPQRRVRVGFRKHLEREFGQHAERARAADQRLMQQKAGGVLDHLAAALHDAPLAVDHADANQEVADAAEAVAARSR